MNHLSAWQNKDDHAPVLARRLNRRLKISSWQDNSNVVLITPTPSLTPLKPKAIKECLQSLSEQGVTRCMTPAVSIAEAQPFFEAGFALKERLHLLSLQLSSNDQYDPNSAHPGLAIKTARRRHEADVLALDNNAFDDFWAFNGAALQEALRATPNSRYRVAVKDKAIVGYAVTGQATNRGYLQRLAVDPSFQGQKIGTSLVYDALCWLEQRGTTRAFVNTQESNTRAFQLYRHLGFTEEEQGLVVLNWESPA